MGNSDVNEKRLLLALEAAGLDLWENDLISGHVSCRATKTFAELGYDAAESCAYVDQMFTIIHPDDIEVVKSAVHAHRSGSTPSYRCEFRLRAKDGSWVWYANYGRIMDEADDELGMRFIGVTFNIHDRKRREDELRQINEQLQRQNRELDQLNSRLKTLSSTDLLTQLPNRHPLLERMQEMLDARQHGSGTGALLFIDIDNFKTINDMLGHDIGDILLRQVATRLQRCVPANATIARFGGDEFLVLLEYPCVRRTDAQQHGKVVSDNIMRILCEPFHLGAHQFQTSVSIGISVIFEEAQTQEDILKQADIALYQAKKAGRGTVRFFDPEMLQAIASRATLENDLRIAIEQGQFQLYYQVKVDTSGRPLGAEGLIRWQHPTRGLVLPAHFIPQAEETGLILPIGDWVLETACARLAAWRGEALTRDLILSVNVSARQFRHTDFVDNVLKCIERHGIDPRLLRLELTESVLLENAEQAIASMRRLNALGVLFSLDDFGTGYSSLQYLKQLPLDQIKIDKSFVHDLRDNSSDKTIVRAIVDMARTLEIDVIAEGVETWAQFDLLLRHGCNKFQGCLFGEPAPLQHFETSLRGAVHSNAE
ncbi:bifunctional diguanylate cyclase/phosphodiesterase [Paludibacterium yongneupense]|uniref:bifunctional diguanylate cyclase/phosphodiesterase n=1 Tax=Paludibacterium yongneupense TaxID=400061 RepID=UPI000407C0C1|nr:GGDEF domain-containing phosphodiesterase [Paludibacterium yongneupense]